MQKFKIISSKNTDEFENLMNYMLQNYEIIDIRYESTDTKYFAYIIYEEKEGETYVN